MNAVKLNKHIEQNNNHLVIAHKASANPSYYVEEAEIGHSKVSVSFFDENETDSDIQTLDIPTKDLIDFTNEFYGAYEECERLPLLGIDYLTENLNTVVTDFLNARLEVANV